MKGIHIAFSGIDGSGKTTMAGILSNYIREKGYSCFLNENNDVFSWNMMQTIAFRNEKVNFRDYFGTDNAELLMSFDALRDYYYKVMPNLLLGNIVVSSRSNYDRICKAELFECSNVNMIEQIQSVTVPEDIHFFMQIDTSCAIERINIRGKDKEEYALLDRYNKILYKHAIDNKWVMINANDDQESVFAQIRFYIDQLLQ